MLLQLCSCAASVVLAVKWLEIGFIIASTFEISPNQKYKPMALVVSFIGIIGYSNLLLQVESRNVR